MVKDNPETNQAQYNRVEKVEINVGSGVNLWLFVAVLVLVGLLIVKVGELERRVNSLTKNN